MAKKQGTSSRLREGYFYVFRSQHALGDGVSAGALAAAKELNCPWMVSCVSDLQKHYFDLPNLLGALCVSWDENSIQRIRDRDFPAINCSNSTGIIAGLGNYVSDDREVGRLAARHLIAKGFREFLLLSYVKGTVHAERREGFLEVLHEQGFPCQVCLNDFRIPREVAPTHLEYVEVMYSIFQKPFQKLPLGAGVFATSDGVASYFLRVMARSYPEHFDTTGVLGVDNDLGTHIHLGVLPGLSSIEPGFYAMGHAAFSWLMKHPGPNGKKETLSQLVRFPPKGVVDRASTACGGCADPMTARMIRWAWERIQSGDPVSVTAMASEHRMSLKTLERKFSEHAGATADETVRSLRLDLARSLLLNTRLPVAEISERCGYAKQDVLSRALRVAEGCSPREFRNASRHRNHHWLNPVQAPAAGQSGGHARY